MKKLIIILSSLLIFTGVADVMAKDSSPKLSSVINVIKSKIRMMNDNDNSSPNKGKGYYDCQEYRHGDAQEYGVYTDCRYIEDQEGS